jgi:hypothetical protein
MEFPRSATVARPLLQHEAVIRKFYSKPPARASGVRPPKSILTPLQSLCAIPLPRSIGEPAELGDLLDNLDAEVHAMHVGIHPMYRVQVVPVYGCNGGSEGADWTLQSEGHIAFDVVGRV